MQSGGAQNVLPDLPFPTQTNAPGRSFVSPGKPRMKYTWQASGATPSRDTDPR